MGLHGKHITRGFGWLALAVWAGAALAATVSVQPTNDYVRLMFAFNQPAKLQMSQEGNNLILSFDRPVASSATAIAPKLAVIADGVDQSEDRKKITLHLKENYRVRQFISGNSVGVDIMHQLASPSPKKVEPEAKKEEPVKVITPTEPTPAPKPEPVKNIAPKKEPPVKVITPESIMPEKSQDEIIPQAPKEAVVPEPAPEQAAAEAKVIRVAPSPILSTKEETLPPAPAPEPAPVMEDEGPPSPNVNPAEALGPVADPILTTKQLEPEPQVVMEKAVPTAPVVKGKQEEAAPVDEVQETEDPNVTPAPTENKDVPFLVGVQPSKHGTEMHFPFTTRVAAAVFERGNDIWLVFSEAEDANVALLRSVLPKAVIKLDQYAYQNATVLRLTTDGSLHPTVSQPKKSYAWNVTLSSERGVAALDIPVNGEKDEKKKSYLEINAFDTSEPLRFFDPIVGDLLVVVPTYELGRGVANQKSTPELTLLATPQGIAITSLRDDLVTARDRTGVKLSAPAPLAVSENLPVLNAGQAPVPGVSAASNVMIPYDQWYVAPENFMDVRAERLAAYQDAKDSDKAAALMELAKMYLGLGMMHEARGYLTLIEESDPDYFTANKLAMLSAAANLLTGHVVEAQHYIDAPEIKDLPEAELWRQAISLVAPQPTSIEMIPQPTDSDAARDEAVDHATAAQEKTEKEEEAVEEEEEEEEVGEMPVSEETSAAEELPGSKEAPMDPMTPPAAAPPEPKVEATDALGPAPAKPDADTPTTPEEEEAAKAEGVAMEAPEPAQPVMPPIKREFNYLDFNKSFIRFYPPRIRQKLAVMAADYYLSSGQPEKSVMTYETLNQDGILEGVQPYAEFMLGTIAAAKDKTKDALRIWDRMSHQQDDPYIRARARFAGIMLRLQKQEITPAEATEALERLRMSWRGDGLEREILTTLADIYRKEKQYDNTLRTMKYLLQGFPGDVDTLTLAGDMSELFEDLFLRGLADDMPPLKSLGLFYEFRELTPIGTKGDQIIQKLADRLAAVDLIDRATQLLEHQIRFRVSGEARARVGARLSLLYLINKQPKRALEVLEITNYGNMPASLKRQRLQLTAQALAENGRPDEALSMLYNDNSPDGSLLRLDILWGMQDWPNVINAAEDILAARPNLTEPLKPRETPVLLKLALAYSFEDDPTQLRYLRDYYMGLVPEGPYKEIFDYLTNDTTPLDPDDFALVAKQISRTESFMDSFRTKIAQGRLSEVAQ